MSFDKLAEGYGKFRKKYFEDDATQEDKDLFKELSGGQSPHTLMISCSDSRVEPAEITGFKPSEVFTHTNVAAIVPPYDANNPDNGTAPVLEYAVKALKVKNIVVMGHSCCGGCGALADVENYRDKFESIAPWVENAKPALEKAKEMTSSNASADEKREAVEQAVVMQSVSNLMTFPWIKDAVQKQELEIHGWYFNIQNGHLMKYEPDTGKFRELAEHIKTAKPKSSCCDTGPSCGCSSKFTAG